MTTQLHIGATGRIASRKELVEGLVRREAVESAGQKRPRVIQCAWKACGKLCAINPRRGGKPRKFCSRICRSRDIDAAHRTACAAKHAEKARRVRLSVLNQKAREAGLVGPPLVDDYLEWCRLLESERAE